jgi:hypothetical protein
MFTADTLTEFKGMFEALRYQFGRHRFQPGSPISYRSGNAAFFTDSRLARSIAPCRLQGASISGSRLAKLLQTHRQHHADKAMEIGLRHQRSSPASKETRVDNSMFMNYAIWSPRLRTLLAESEIQARFPSQNGAPGRPLSSYHQHPFRT